MTVWKDRQARGIGLVVLTGLTVSWVRQGLQHHWHGFGSWESFFISWVIHTIGVSVFSAFAAAAIMGTHKFFLGEEWKGDVGEATFYVVMTVLVGAFAIAIVANAPINDEDAGLSPLYQTVIGFTEESVSPKARELVRPT